MSRNTTITQTAAVQVIPIDKIDDGPNPLRLDLGIESDEMQELVESIKAQGVLQPIGVYPADSRFVQVFGFRRKLAAMIANLTEIPASILKPPAGPSELLVIQLQENIQRLDVEPIRYGETLQTLQDELGCTQQELARIVSLHPVKVTRLLAAARLPEQIKSLVAEKRLPVSTALELAQLDEAEREETILKALSGKVTRDELVAQRRSAIHHPQPKGRSGRVTLRLDGGRTISIAGINKSIDALLDALQVAVLEARKARQAGLSLDTFARTQADRFSNA